MSGWPNNPNQNFEKFTLDRYMVEFYDKNSKGVLEGFQRLSIGRLLKHVDTVSDWWRDRLGAAQLGNGVGFRQIPLMSRDAYRGSLLAAPRGLPLPEGHGTAMVNTTSGSSGIPLSFNTSSLASRLNSAHYSYDRVRHGIGTNGILARLTSRIAEHTGSHMCAAPNIITGQCAEYRRKSNKFTVEEHARWIAKVQPTYIYANVRLLTGVLDAYEDGLAEPPSTKIKAFLSFAETVTPEFRSRAHRILGARVLDRYSCEEAGPLAFQCPISDDHLHIAGSNVVIEVLDEHEKPCAPGETGRVFITSLHNYANPVIRYELGDLSAWAPRCVCGYDKPVLFNLLGRVRFLVRLPSGGRKHVVITAKDWLSVAPFHETRVVQVSEGLIHAEYVIDRPLTEFERVKLISILRSEISPDLTYELKQVDSIDWGPTYKRQDVISLI